MSEQLKQELEADTDRLEAETVADSETIGEQEEKPTEGKLEDQKGDGVITRTGATVGILHQKRFIREMLSCTTRICQIH